MADLTKHCTLYVDLLLIHFVIEDCCFDMDFDDGEIYYRVTIHCGDKEFAPPTYEQIDFSFKIGINMVEKYGDALLKVMLGLAEPADEIAIVDADD